MGIPHLAGFKAPIVDDLQSEYNGFHSTEVTNGDYTKNRVDIY